MSGRVGIVVIGRNEGVRLRRSLASVLPEQVPLVFVDSGSSDDSAAYAEQLGIEVVRLTQGPLTAARARNAGAQHLAGVELVQFLDGDCELCPGWLAAATAVLEADPSLAVVCGRRRERDRDASVYTRLCDIEWDTPVGEALACGGDALMRMTAFVAVGGFDPDMPAGEEPELCVRLRHAGWKIRRLDADMSVHDSGMRHFGQWWVRARRAGYAFANGAALHGRSAERFWVWQSLRSWLWALAVPVTALVAALLVDMRLAAVVGLLYPLSLVRNYRAARQRGLERRDAGAYGVACVIAKFPEFVGQLQYLWAHAGRGSPGDRR